MSYLWLEESEIPICLWGNTGDANVFEHREEVQRLADKIGKCEIYEAHEGGER